MNAVLTGSFRAPASAVIRFTRGGSVDWTVTEGDYWPSLVAMLADWSAVIDGAGLGSIDFDVDEDNHRLSVAPSGSGWSITWSHTGDGTAIRDAFGANGATTTTAFLSHAPCSYVARYGAVRLRQTETRYNRGHRVAADGEQQTQHAWAPGELPTRPAELELWTGTATGALSYASHEQLVEFFDSLWDQAGHAEPFSVHLLKDGDLDTADSWVLRWDTDQPEIRPARVSRSETDRLWSIRLAPLIAEVIP